MTELEKAAKDARQKKETEWIAVEAALYHYYQQINEGKSASFSESARKFGVPYWKVRDLHRKIEKDLKELEESEGDNE